MKVSHEIKPFFEAIMYLNYRFAERRTSDRIADIKPDPVKMPIKNWAYFQKIAALEAELDSEFAADELLRYYFTPMKTKEKTPGSVLSPGWLLLTFPDALDYDEGIHGLDLYYRRSDIEERLFNFCDIYQFSSELHLLPKCRNITDFMKVLDTILVEPEDKWKLLDIVADPCRHLEKLHPLVNAVADRFSKSACDFAPILEGLCSDLDSFESMEQILHFLNVELLPEDSASVVFCPSLYLFSGIFFRTYNNSTQIMLGAFLPSLACIRENKGNIKNYADLLKILSDNTRLSALYALCNNYSYGQELAEQIGGTRNAMYYHLDKLFGYGLVNRKETEYRTLYTMNKKNVYDRLTALRDFLVDGWKPEDEGKE